MSIYDISICIIVSLTALRAFKTHEHALYYWLWINAIMISWAFNREFSVASMYYLVPAVSNTVIALLISNDNELSRPAYFLLVGTILAAIVNMFSAVAVLFYQAGVFSYPASVYQGIMLVPLAVMLFGFIKVGHGHYKRADSGFSHHGLDWALHRFVYQKTG